MDPTISTISLYTHYNNCIKDNSVANTSNTINELSPFVKKLYYRWKNYLNDHEAIKVHLPNLHIFFEKTVYTDTSRFYQEAIIHSYSKEYQY